MSGIKYVLSEKGSSVCMPAAAAKKLISSGRGDAALCYLHILLNDGIVDAEAIEKSAKLSVDAVKSALLELNAMGILRPDDTCVSIELPHEDAAPPDYTMEDIQNALTSTPSFSDLVSDIQEKLGKKLTTEDLRHLLTICDHLQLPHDYVLLLVTYCINETKKRSSGSRLPTMRYIEKVAFSWEKEGITTYEDCIRHIAELDARLSAEAEYAAALQISDRRLTPSERRYVSGWIAMGFAPDIVAMAYDITVFRTGRRSWNYLDSILKRWHAKNLRTKEQIEKSELQEKKKNTSIRAPAKPVRDDTELMRRLMDDIEEN